MKLHWYCILWMAAACGSARASEPACYPTAEAAAAQAGARGVEGFRLEGRRRDVFSGAVWATVKSCTHPERPGILVMAAGDVGDREPVRKNEPTARVLLGGTRVTLIQTEEAVHIEMRGIAQGSGAIGDRVRVRLLTLEAGDAERFVDGIVRGRDVVEVLAR